MELQDVIYTKERHLATITLNRPERLNAFSLPMIEGITKALEDADKDQEIRVIVITGAGRGFCAGLDMKAIGDIEPEIVLSDMPRVTRLPVLALSIDKPTIASINGPAIGWGFELALLCDIRIASEEARIGDLHVQRGLIADNGGIFLLPRLIGWAKACEIYLSGEMIDGREAERIGLVNRAVPPGELETATREMATKIANQAPLAVRMGKRALRLGLGSDLQASLDTTFYLQGMLFQTEDFREAISSFVEKREPVFKGR